MRIAVTGATSMIGRALVARLLERGDHVTTIQRTPTSVGTIAVSASIDDVGALRSAFAGCDAIVHLAARVGVVGTWDQFEATNVGGTVNVIDAARHAGVGRLVHVSSPSVAHAGEPLVGADAEPASPDTVEGHYSRSKAMAEIVAIEAAGAEMAVVAIRPHLVWGPGDTQLVGRIVDRARAGRLVLVGDGSALIDTTYVDNAADALVAAVDRAEVCSGRALVVSNGEPRTVHELVCRIVAAAGIGWRPRSVPVAAATRGGTVVERLWGRLGREDDPPMTKFLAEQLSTAHWFDQAETRRLLEWVPSVTLAEGFRRLTEDLD